MTPEPCNVGKRGLAGTRRQSPHSAPCGSPTAACPRAPRVRLVVGVPTLIEFFPIRQLTLEIITLDDVDGFFRFIRTLGQGALHFWPSIFAHLFPHLIAFFPEGQINYQWIILHTSLLNQVSCQHQKILYTQLLGIRLHNFSQISRIGF